MINREDYRFYGTKSLYKPSNGKARAFTVPIAILRLLGLAEGGRVTVSMAKDMSHIIIEPEYDRKEEEVK